MNKIKMILAGSVLLFSGAAMAAEQVSVTVYNSNLGLVRSVRQMPLKEGTSEIRFADVASQIDPTSVHFKSLTAPDKTAVLEQNYEYELVDANKILSKYIDQQIQVFTKEGKMFDGKLLSSSDEIVLEKKDGGVQSVSRANIQNVDFPKLPLGLITRPTLVWTVASEKGGTHDMEVSYLTGGINWHAEYVAVLDKDDKKIDLSAWVSVDNKSGAAYQDAKVKLIAGEVHRAVEQEPMYDQRMLKTAMAMERSDQFQEKAFFEYHLYTLQRPATIKNNQIKQLQLFPSASVSVKKIYEYEAQSDPNKVKVAVEFTNSKAENLGMPLPAGKVRIYKQDSDKSQEFVGEDALDHTPKDEKIRLTLGDVFDVAVERTEKDIKNISERVQQRTAGIKIRNHKDSDIEVLVAEKFWGDWEITKSNFPHTKKDSVTAEFKIPVKKDGETILEYTVQNRW